MKKELEEDEGTERGIWGFVFSDVLSDGSYQLAQVDPIGKEAFMQERNRILAREKSELDKKMGPRHKWRMQLQTRVGTVTVEGKRGRKHQGRYDLVVEKRSPALIASLSPLTQQERWAAENMEQGGVSTSFLKENGEIRKQLQKMDSQQDAPCSTSTEWNSLEGTKLSH